MKRIVLFLLVTTGLAAALHAQKTTLSGSVTGLPQGARLVLSSASKDKLKPVDTLRLDAKGEFKVTLRHEEPTLYVLQTTARDGAVCHLMLEPKDRVSVKIAYIPDRRAFCILSSKGSRNVELYRQFNDYILAASTPELQAQLPQRIEQLLLANKHILMSAFLVTFFDSNFDSYVPLYMEVRDALVKDYAEVSFVKNLNQRLAGVVLPGMEAPEIAMPDSEGVERKLSDLRGNVVLIDFWASWCGPCRRENPNVVRLYERFHDQGFEIYSVSLDKDREAWLKAIRDDRLSWPNHVSDLNGWTSSGGKTYGIRSVPSTVLVDREGKVVARNLRGSDLERKLEQLLEQ